jgi:hypothetical protein
VPRQFPFRNGEIKLEFVYPIGIFNAPVKSTQLAGVQVFPMLADDLAGELAPGLLATGMLLFETRANFFGFKGGLWQCENNREHRKAERGLRA